MKRIIRNDFAPKPALRELIIEGDRSRVVLRPDNPRSTACAFIMVGLEGEGTFSLTVDEAEALSDALQSLIEEHEEANYAGGCF